MSFLAKAGGLIPTAIAILVANLPGARTDLSQPESCNTIVGATGVQAKIGETVRMPEFVVYIPEYTFDFQIFESRKQPIYLERIEASNQQNAITHFLERVAYQPHWYFEESNEPIVEAVPSCQISDAELSELDNFEAEGCKGKIYYDQYLIGGKIVRREQPSLKQEPVSIGPFRFWIEAEIYVHRFLHDKGLADSN